MLKKVCFLIIYFVINLSISAQQLRLPSVFSSNMVLQQNSKVTLWGWASSYDQVTITTSWSTKTLQVKAGVKDSIWKTIINTPSAGGPYTITIKAKDKELKLENVLIGEVWICSGQSNMEWYAAKGMTDSLSEVPKANYPNIRMFNVQKSTSETPSNDCFGTWNVCTPQVMNMFSAVGYFFGKTLNENLNIPIGLINASWGGSPIEIWMKGELVESDTLLKKEAYKNLNIWAPIKPGVTFNSMIHPFVCMPIAGAIWYQGESNVRYYPTYSRLFKMLVNSWRSEWKKDFPFYYVQLAPHNYFRLFKDNIRGAYQREQQTQCLSIPKTGMVVTTDLVTDTSDIHPRNKKGVGIRLANMALTDTYNKKGIASKFPTYKSMKVEKDKIRIFFNFVEKELICKGKELSEFYIAGEDKIFHKAVAIIDKKTIIVSSENVKKPVAVRFAFRNSPIPNLFSSDGLPATPFRTDNW